MPTENRQFQLSNDPDEIRRQLSQLNRAERHAILQEAKAALSRTDFVRYNEFVHDWVFEPHHKEWTNILMTHRRACIVAPPESGKSRILRSLVEWRIGQDQDMAWLYIQNTGRQASLQVSAIGNVIIDPKYRLVYPHIKSTERWSGEKLFIDRVGTPKEFRPDATVAAYSYDGAYQGAHVDGIVIDDPTDQKDVISPVVMQSQRELIKGVLYDRVRQQDDPEGEGYLYVILTRWGDDDLLQMIDEDLRIPIFTFPAIRDEPYPWGDNLLTARYTREYLQELEEKKGPDLFKLSFLCSSSGAIRGKRVFGERLHKNVHFKKFAPNELDNKAWKKKAMGVDWGTTIAHKTAIVSVCKDADGVCVVRGAWQSPKGSSAELLDKAAEHRSRFGIRNAWIDRSQGSLRDQFEYQLGMGAFKGESSVELRIGALLTLIDTGRFRVDPEAGEAISELWNQLMSYARDENGRIIEKSDDLVDALLYALAALQEPVRSGLGPKFEIVPTEDDQPMADAYHDNFDPANFSEDALNGVVVKPPRIQDYTI